MAQTPEIDLIKQQMKSLEAAAETCGGIGCDPTQVTGAATALMRTLDVGARSGSNAVVAKVARDAVEVVEPLGLNELAKNFQRISDAASGQKQARRSI